MVKVIHKIQAEISKPNFFQAIVAKQFDSGSRFLNVTFVHEGNKIDLPNTSTVMINATRNDGSKEKFAGTVGSDGTATVPLAYWMLELEGKVICDVSAIDTSGRKLTTTNFTIEVEKASCDSGDVSEDENYDVLLKLIEDVGKVTPVLVYDPTSENAQSGIAVAEGIKKETSIFANAFKGSVSGDTVVIDDVSPIAHTPNVMVHGKNFFDISKITPKTNTNGQARISEVGNDYLIVNTTDGYTGNGYATTEQRLKEVCPRLEIGKTYILSATTESNSTNIYFSGIGASWKFGSVMVVTEALLNSVLTFYGLSATHGYGTGDCRISNIQIEEGETATEYTPYIDPTTVTVTEETTGATYTPNAEGICEVTSVSPTMTLSTNTVGVTVECEYNKDTNAVMGDIGTALDSIIAMQMSYIGGAE